MISDILRQRCSRWSKVTLFWIVFVLLFFLLRILRFLSPFNLTFYLLSFPTRITKTFLLFRPKPFPPTLSCKANRYVCDFTIYHFVPINLNTYNFYITKPYKENLPCMIYQPIFERRS